MPLLKKPIGSNPCIYQGSCPLVFWKVALSGTMAFALGADFIPKERMGEGVGFLGIGQIIGMAIGPNVGIILLERFSYQVCFAVSGVVIMMAGLSICALKYNHFALEKTERTFRFQDLVAVELFPNVGFVAVFMLGNGLVTSFLVLIGYERGIEGVGLYFVIHAIVVLVTRPVIGRMTDSKGVAYAIIPGYILAAVAMMVIGMGYSVLPVVLAAILFALGAGSAMPAIQTDCLQRLDRTRRTVATGTYMIGLDIGMTVGPMLGGVMADVYGFRVTFVSAGFLMLAGFVIYLLYRNFNKVSGNMT